MLRLSYRPGGEREEPYEPAAAALFLSIPGVWRRLAFINRVQPSGSENNNVALETR